MMDYIEKIVWHEVTTRPPTEEENERYKRATGIEAGLWFDCKMPKDGDEILIKTKWGVDTDICCEDEYGIGLDERGDWEDVLAWAEMPTGKGGEADG